MSLQSAKKDGKNIVVILPDTRGKIFVNAVVSRVIYKRKGC